MKKSALKPVWKALGTIAKQHAMESAAMDSQRHVVQEATRRSRDEVVAGTIAEMTTILLRQSTEREELDKKQSQELTTMHSKVQDQ